MSDRCLITTLDCTATMQRVSVLGDIRAKNALNVVCAACVLCCCVLCVLCTAMSGNVVTKKKRRIACVIQSRFSTIEIDI